jgi:hypothetical protein
MPVHSWLLLRLAQKHDDPASCPGGLFESWAGIIRGILAHAGISGAADPVALHHHRPPEIKAGQVPHLAFVDGADVLYPAPAMRA